MPFDLNPGQRDAFEAQLATERRFVALYGGSRSGKTALLCSTIMDRALVAPGSRHLILRRTNASAVRSIVKDTFPKVWGLKFPGVPTPKYNAMMGFYEFPDGSEVWIGGVNDDNALERILGNEYATIYGNEASELKFESFTLLRSRLAQVCQMRDGVELRQKFWLDLNPTTINHWTYKLFIKKLDPETGAAIANPEQYGHHQINPKDNAANLARDYLNDLQSLGTVARKRFWDGEYGGDAENALWRRDWIKVAPYKADGNTPVDMQSIVVAIDPATTSKPGSNETGIIVAGLGVDRMGYVLDDESGIYRPEEWAARAVALFHAWGADKIIYEANQGGDMVKSQLQAVEPNLSPKAVWASRGKITRAEPIAALYELGKVKHCDNFSVLEDQLCSVTVDFDRKAEGYSPDRMDALVWALTHLFPTLTRRQNRDSGRRMTTNPNTVV